MIESKIITGDALTTLRTMPSDSVDCCVTSPPYWGLRDYGHDGQMGIEPTPESYVAGMVEVFREVRRVLKPEGTLWLNLGDSYAGSWGAQGRQGKTGELAGRTACAERQIAAAAKRESQTGSLARTPGLKAKDLVGIPWRVAFSLQADGWYLRSDIIWAKNNPMPESVTDRPTKAHEYLFLMAKSERYFYDQEAISEPATVWGPRNRNGKYESGGTGLAPHGGLSDSDQRETRNRRTVWTIPTKPFSGAHFAVMPEALVEPCILAGCPGGGLVLDPFAGSGTVGVVARRTARCFVGIELNAQYAAMAVKRINSQDQGLPGVA